LLKSIDVGGFDSYKFVYRVELPSNRSVELIDLQAVTPELFGPTTWVFTQVLAHR